MKKYKTNVVSKTEREILVANLDYILDSFDRIEKRVIEAEEKIKKLVGDKK